MAIKELILRAETITYHPVSLWLDDNGDLNYRRSYSYLDADGNVVIFEHYGMGDVQTVLKGKMAWADVPQDIKDALTTIDAYTKNEIRKKEGLS